MDTVIKPFQAQQDPFKHNKSAASYQEKLQELMNRAFSLCLE